VLHSRHPFCYTHSPSRLFLVGQHDSFQHSSDICKPAQGSTCAQPTSSVAHLSYHSTVDSLSSISPLINAHIGIMATKQITLEIHSNTPRAALFMLWLEEAVQRTSGEVAMLPSEGLRLPSDMATWQWRHGRNDSGIAMDAGSKSSPLSAGGRQ